jgi:hypothetical protein
MRVRAGLITVIYQKALILSNDERGKASGDIVNLMSVDASRLQDLCTYGLMAISAPFQVTDNTARANTSILTTRRLKGHACIHLAVQPPRVVCVRGGSHHAVFGPVEYHDRKFLEEPSDTADEKQGQAFASDE